MRSSNLVLALIASLAAAPVLAQPEPAAPTQTAGDPVAGKEAYALQCSACHTGAIGPVLEGVHGRKIAGVESFGRYSNALKSKSDQSWTDENLDAFLKEPSDFAPGTRMMMGASDDKSRADIIAYLKTLSAPAP